MIQQNEKMRNAQKPAAVFLIIILILSSLMLTIGYFGRENGNLSRDEGLVMREDESASEIGAEDNASPRIRVPGYDNISFPAGESTVEMTLLNPEGNNCSFVYELYIDDAEDPVYTSGLILPAKKITRINLKEPLDCGQYTAYLKVNAYSLEDEAPLNGAIVKIPLSVY